MSNINDPARWENILIKAGLGVNRGINKKILCDGTSNDLVILEELQLNETEGQLEDGGRRVVPGGRSPNSKYEGKEPEIREPAVHSTFDSKYVTETYCNHTLKDEVTFCYECQRLVLGDGKAPIPV